LSAALEKGCAEPEATFNLALAELTLGDYRQGFEHFEARWQTDHAPTRHPQPLWQGENFAGRTLLLTDEQGLGDTIQMLRFVPAVLALGGELVLSLSARLKRLAEASFPSVRVIERGGQRSAAQLLDLTTGQNSDLTSELPHFDLPHFDLHCPLMSLPRLFHCTPETIPVRAAYLKAPAAAREKAVALPWAKDRLRIGLAWAGNPSNRTDQRRSMHLRTLRHLFELDSVNFHSLQMGEAASQAVELNAPLTDLAPYTADLADTAAQMEHLDLIITVDTAVAHLAGALGKTTWLMLPFAADWRWLTGRANSPWYPSMRLYRQQQPGDWAPVVAVLREELEALAKVPADPRKLV